MVDHKIPDFEKIIRQAAKYLGPKPNHSAIEQALADCGTAAWKIAAFTQDGRRSIQRVEVLLRRLAAAINTLPTPGPHVPSSAQIENWIAGCNLFLTRPRRDDHGFSKGVGYFEKYCALKAHELLLLHNRKISTTKKVSDFEKLTACLASCQGRLPSGQLHHACRQVVIAIGRARKAA